MRRTVFGVIVATMGLLAAPRAASSQTIRGTLVDSVTGRPVTGVTVELRRLTQVVGRARTDTAGAFVLTVPGAGSYVVGARVFGYAPMVTASRRYEAGESYVVRLTLAPRAASLDTVRATGRGTSFFDVTPGRTWFARHYAEGKGIFFSGMDVLASKRDACDYFGNLPGLVAAGTRMGFGFLCLGGNGLMVTSKNAQPCLATVVDRLFYISGVDSISLFVRNLRAPRLPRGNVADPEDTISMEIPLSRVRGVEVFLDRTTLPHDFGVPALDDGSHLRLDINPGSPKGGVNGLRDCALLLAWTDIVW